MSQAYEIAITGSSGFVGSHLRRAFPRHRRLRRHGSVDELARAVEGCRFCVNLAGAPIIHRWTAHHKREMWDSRISTTRRLVEAMEAAGCPHLVSTSAVGIYPDGTECDESCPQVAGDFLGDLARAWEEEALRFSGRVTILRFGVILGREGGALKRMLLPFRLGLGGPIGDGSMVMSWLDIADLMAIYRWVFETGATGVVNCCSPEPVTNLRFTKALARVLHRPALLPVPRPMLWLLFGQGASVLTASKIALPARLLEKGFRFRFPTIEESLAHLLG